MATNAIVHAVVFLKGIVEIMVVSRSHFPSNRKNPKMIPISAGICFSISDGPVNIYLNAAAHNCPNRARLDDSQNSSMPKPHCQDLPSYSHRKGPPRQSAYIP